MGDIHVTLVVDKRETAHQDLSGKVVFHAAEDCTVHFSNPAVFNMEFLDVKQGQPTTVTAVKTGSTTWNALTPATGTSGKKGKHGDAAGNPNEIVVP